MSATLVFVLLIAAVVVTAAVTAFLLRAGRGDRDDAAARFELLLERAKNDLTATQRELVDSSRADFLALAGQRLDTTQAGIAAKLSELVAPVGEKLNQVDAFVRELEQARLTAYAELRTQVEQLTKSGGELSLATATLSERTTKLASALRNPQTRGRWGELQLQRVCELAGMLEHCDFEAQKRFVGIEKAQQPDLIVKLPQDRFICVDAKVPLDAYLDAVESNDEAAKAAHFKRYGDALKSRINALAAAKYQTIPGSVDFVVMFIPGENFLSAAYSQDEDIIEFAAKKAVYVVGPLTFMALLRSYGMVWQSLKQEQNVREIAAQGRVVFDRVRILSDHLNDLGKSLNAAVTAYNKAVGSYESRLLPGSRELAKLAGNPEAATQGEIERIESNAGAITALSAQEAAFALAREEERDRIALQDGSLGG
ncbi:MAG: DNA recombination protein RmuC [Candidatus Baltobacteraceae bacterium]